MMGFEKLGEKECLVNIVQSFYRNDRSRVRFEGTLNYNLLVRLGPGVVACTCNPATLEAGFRKDVGSLPVGGNSLFKRWMDCVTNTAQGEEPD